MYFTSGSDRAFEQLMQTRPGADHFDSGEAGAPEDCGTCRFYRPHWKYQFCVYEECPYQPGKRTALDGAVKFQVKGVDDEMAVFRVEKNRGYTVMSNHHLRNAGLSLKSKGLLSMMLSLPDEWNYTTRGLAAICREGVDSIGAALKELETHGYIRRTQLRDEKGKITDTEYVIYEMPQCEPPSSPGTPLPGTAKPYTENPDMGVPDTAEPCTENPAQLNTNQTKTDLSSTEISNPIQSNPPTPAGARMGTDRMGARECYREVILDNIEYSYLVQDNHIDREQLDEIVDLIVDTVCSARKVIRIAGDDYPAEVVKSRFMKLDSSHVQYVMDCMKDNTTYVRNIKKYLLAALYNAPTTINSYYSSLVQHDMYGDGQRGRG